MKPEWGSRRQCKKCSAAFYDLQRESFECPKCGVAHTLDDFRAKSRADARKGKKKEAKIALEDDAPEILDDEEITQGLDDDALIDDEDDAEFDSALVTSTVTDEDEN